jgi:hypothetical protein
MSVPVPAVPRPAPGVVSRRVGNGGVLVHLGTSHVYELNETGWTVWEGLDRGTPLADIAGGLADRYEPAGASVAADVRALIDELLRLGLVV